MNAKAIVFRLLEDYAPEGYHLVDTAEAGNYELKLWQGLAHVDGKPVKFNEVSLNAKGLDFDPESQHKKHTGSTYALGHRREMLSIINNWIQRRGALYIGSYVPAKLKIYHKLFKRYLPRFCVSDMYAPFDECEGKPEYFYVTPEC